MGLFVLSGYLLSENLGWNWAIPAFLVVGLLIAPLIPAKTACGIKTSPTGEKSPTTEES